MVGGQQAVEEGGQGQGWSAWATLPKPDLCPLMLNVAFIKFALLTLLGEGHVNNGGPFTAWVLKLRCRALS